MKFLKFAALLSAAFFSCGTSMVSGAQTPATPPSAPTPPAAQPTEPHGQVIFSRSMDENGETTTQTGPARSPKMEQAPTAGDSEREAITFTDFDMDVHLRTEAHLIAVRAQLTVRNDGKAPLNRVPLQISSSLTWERIRVQGKDA